MRGEIIRRRILLVKVNMIQGTSAKETNFFHDLSWKISGQASPSLSVKKIIIHPHHLDCNVLEGKIAVITGGSSGIGLATAQRFVQEGAYVFIAGRPQGEVDTAVNQIGKCNVIGVQGDVSMINLAKGDKVLIRWTNSGTNTGTLFGNPTNYKEDTFYAKYRT